MIFPLIIVGKPPPKYNKNELHEKRKLCSPPAGTSSRIKTCHHSHFLGEKSIKIDTKINYNSPTIKIFKGIRYHNFLNHPGGDG